MKGGHLVWICVALQILADIRISSGVCYESPAEPRFFLPDSIHRLGNTRFFVHWYPTEYINSNHLGFKKATWSEWLTINCRRIHRSAKLSVLDKISTNAIIARHLELLTKEKNFTNFDFFIAARGAGYGQGNTGVYMWNTASGYNQEAKSQIEYSNVFYKAPRIIGLQRHRPNGYYTIANESMENAIDYEHNEIENDPKKRPASYDRCLAFSLPFKNNPSLGFQASWTERWCDNAASAICEINLPECNENENLNPHVLTEDKEYYYTDGNWLFSNRRFIVSWKPRKKGDADQYCRDNNLKLFEPSMLDMCLIPYLKMWGMVISTYSFYTSYKYDRTTKEFMTIKGEVVQTGAKKPHKYMEGRSFDPSSRNYEEVAYVWSYERKNETACSEMGCKWMYYMLAPIKGQLTLGTICQHEEEDNLRACDFERDWNDDFTEALAPTAVSEFGYQGSGFWRSNYKQTFGSHICGDPDRQMISVETNYWDIKIESIEYRYDYDETYWVVEYEGQMDNDTGKHEPLCSVSSLKQLPTNGPFERTLTKVNCDEWHFYLCELVY